MKLTIDFECRSPVDIKKAGPWKYAEDPNTTPLCLAVKAKHNRTIWVNPAIENSAFPNDPGFHWAYNPEYILKSIAVAETVEAHNSFFELSIWRNIMAPRYGWPDIPDHKWRCSAAKAAAHALPRSLEGAGAALGLNVKKDMDGHRIMMKMCRPRKPRKGEDPDGLYWHEDPEDFLKLFRYCLQDVEAEHAISEALDDLNPVEQRVWFLDQKMNERGILADTKSAEKIIHTLNKYEKTLLDEVREITGGQINSVKQVAAMAEYCGCASMTKDCVAETLENENLTPQVRRVLEIRQIIGRASVSKFKAIIERACGDGRLRGNLMYHGASTGRWVGKGVQLQNLVRKSLAESDFDLASLLFHDLDTVWIDNCFGFTDPVELAQALIRPMITAKPGYDLLCADFSSIEARALLWLAGETEGVELFRAGADIYCDMAGDIYDRIITKADKKERQVGKTAILGLGYGMGAPKFKLTCATQAGVEIDKKFARKVVKVYRKKYPKVPMLWYSLEGAAVQCVQTRDPVECGKVTWIMHGRFLQCVLPSGRKLSYPYPTLRMEPAFIYPAADDEGTESKIMIVGGTRAVADKKAKKQADAEELRIIGFPIEKEKAILSFMAVVNGQWTREHTYGGKLCENVDSAFARDLLAAAMLRLESRGYECILSVHDEVIAEVPEGFGSVEKFESIMSEVPPWADDCPVAAEGWRGKRYRK